jgi:solute carrier family 25 carnitine/acylcarnitine transporter 20/29
MRDLAYGPYFCTYEATCRLFKSFKPKPDTSLATGRLDQPLAEELSGSGSGSGSGAGVKKRIHHESLIDEAEMELASGLNWGELMAAGGIAGVVAWLVSGPPRYTRQ